MLQTKCINHKYIQGVSRSKIHPGRSHWKLLIENATIRSTARDCHTKMYYQGCYYSKYTHGMTQSNILPGSATSQYGCKGVSQSKDCHGISRQMSIKMKRIAGSLTIKVLPGSATLLMTKGSITVKTTVMVNEPQSKWLPMSATKNMTVRKYHNLKYFKGVSQSKGLSVSI